jgi:CheY-like chemotaxis protein
MKQQGTPLVRPAILLAERGEGFRILPSYLLRNEGFHVLQASHGYEALYHAHRHPYAVQALIAEIDLPMMDGRELSSRLRELNPQLKTILLTGKPQRAGLSCNTICLPAGCGAAAILRTLRAFPARTNWHSAAA